MRKVAWHANSGTGISVDNPTEGSGKNRAAAGNPGDIRGTEVPRNIVTAGG
jgi:hypothetical protein